MRFSVIVPVYNRPREVRELLQSLTEQSFKSFEIIIVEDGSDITCREITENFSESLNIRYYYKENSGQGFSRNFGFQKAAGEYFVVFDSDCLIPSHYFETVNQVINEKNIDCWGGPDRAHDSFTPVQKAINYSMTSIFTTGGIRGKSEKFEQFYPRSFNMGISREVFEATGGYKITRMGEDLELSIRISKAGFRTVLIKDAYVYHKRRSTFIQFFKQLHFFGRARVNIGRFHPEQIKLMHTFPLLFTVGFIVALTSVLLSIPVFKYLIIGYLLYALLLAADSYIEEKNPVISLYSVIAGFIQLTGYGFGFAGELFKSRK
ncbi:glycosyltransferase [Rhodohalobacter sp. SW132]|uniref:glycosyltransferase n=1 Tax=Rhodohalobacter sp. SW132 TaxID=2293433 RepID=UPI000E25425C|nr:glycosyltransferase [Rhodohalobacter sp. SW132]REL33221.1 glycosyltransferase [Rhodohalobacter sp. SW132]